MTPESGNDDSIIRAGGACMFQLVAIFSHGEFACLW